MAPELFMGRNSDYRVDIYALGVILYEMLTGQKPFTAENSMAVFIKKVSEPLLSPKIIIPELPSKVEKVLLEALAMKPDDRYMNMSAFILDMQGLLGQGSIFRRLFRTV